MVPIATGGLRGIWRELRYIGRRGRQVWRLVPWRHRWALAGAELRSRWLPLWGALRAPSRWGAFARATNGQVYDATNALNIDKAITGALANI